eukprot:1154601-Pelagomonas_calceolata.AAC.6
MGMSPTVIGMQAPLQTLTKSVTGKARLHDVAFLRAQANELVGLVTWRFYIVLPWFCLSNTSPPKSQRTAAAH